MKLFLIILAILISMVDVAHAKVLSACACQGCKDRNRIPVISTASEGRVVRPGVNHDIWPCVKPTEPVPYEPVRGVAVDTQCLWVGPHDRMVPDEWYQQW